MKPEAELSYGLINIAIEIPIELVFAKAYDEASKLSGLGPYRMRQLWTAVRQVGKLPAGDILEVGTYKGGSALLLQRAIEHFEVPCSLIACDTFKGLVKASPVHDVWKSGEMVYSDEAAVRAVLPKALILAGIFPNDTGHYIADRTFRLVHIDVDIYQSAKDIWDWVWPRLVPGGVIMFDDCEIPDTPGITRLITELESTPGTFWTRNHMGQALCVKL